MHVPADDAPDESASADLLALVHRMERALWAAEESPAGRVDAFGVHDRLRFAAAVGLAFPPTASRLADGALRNSVSEPHRIEALFFGLTGPMGVLPTHISSMLAGSHAVDSTPLQKLLEILDHRAISLFVRASQRSMPLRGLERRVVGGVGDNDPLTEALEGLVGQLNHADGWPLSLSRWATVFYAGHFACSRRPPSSLAAMLREATGFETRVIESVGGWRRLPPGARSAFGRPESSKHAGPDPSNSRLGGSVCLGSRVWTCQETFRLRIGPVDYPTFCRMQPSEDLHTQLSELVALYVGSSLKFEFQVILPPDEVPRCALSAGPKGVRLRRSAWLTSRGFDEVVDDAVFAGGSIVRRGCQTPAEKC